MMRNTRRQFWDMPRIRCNVQHRSERSNQISGDCLVRTNSWMQYKARLPRKESSHGTSALHRHECSPSSSTMFFKAHDFTIKDSTFNDIAGDQHITTVTNTYHHSQIVAIPSSQTATPALTSITPIQDAIPLPTSEPFSSFISLVIEIQRALSPIGLLVDEPGLFRPLEDDLLVLIKSAAFLGRTLEILKSTGIASLFGAKTMANRLAMYTIPLQKAELPAINEAEIQTISIDFGPQCNTIELSLSPYATYQIIAASTSKTRRISARIAVVLAKGMVYGYNVHGANASIGPSAKELLMMVLLELRPIATGSARILNQISIPQLRYLKLHWPVYSANVPEIFSQIPLLSTLEIQTRVLLDNSRITQLLVDAVTCLPNLEDINVHFMTSGDDFNAYEHKLHELAEQRSGVISTIGLPPPWSLLSGYVGDENKGRKNGDWNNEDSLQYVEMCAIARTEGGISSVVVEWRPGLGDRPGHILLGFLHVSNHVTKSILWFSSELERIIGNLESVFPRLMAVSL
ncbi:hypothetical protein PLEOSDRAFT_1080104 [Pleurotus ostreatus PC15]|uniref:Uncharacterized protein n=1 Tax=Pleurotus ostreatus (strain PC15) TaxID=1137138 RepID=A0A067P9F3_PLEO1|nr:hypothetical protein PLEOSDRAFT_1080104 [Pleurotus ostreatus PC15]